MLACHSTMLRKIIQKAIPRPFSSISTAYQNRFSPNSSEGLSKSFIPSKSAPNQLESSLAYSNDATKSSITPFQEECSNQSFVLSNDSISSSSFSSDAAQCLQEEVDPNDIEIRQDGFLYLPEIKYRSILLRAFGPGGWSLIPKGGHSINNDFISREYWLLCHGKFVSSSRGFGMIRNELSDAVEGAKSNALMRCCKDLGIARELWNPEYVRKWKEAFATSFTTPDGKRTIWKKISSMDSQK